MRRGFVPALLFVVAAGGVALLGSRILASERAAAEDTARQRLRARLREAEALLRTAAARDPAAGVRAVHCFAGSFAWEPLPFDRLAPFLEDDPEAAFYLAEGERAEVAAGEPERAAGLYRAAAVDGRGLHSRLTALFRLAALERRRGSEAIARGLEEDFLRLLPDSRRRTLEALVIRARREPPDEDLPRDLALALDTPDEIVARGLLGDSRAPRSQFWLDHMREVHGRIERLRPVASALAADGSKAPYAGWGVGGGRVVTWKGGGAGVSLDEDLLPELPEGVRVSHGGTTGAGSDDFAESLDLGDPPLSFRLVASIPRSAVEAEARRGAWMLGCALAALLVAGGAAFILSFRAARREAEAARSRAAFVTKVGHDLRTPLAVVRMYAETLAAGKVADPAEAREFASVAAREAERLTGMVGQVLDLSRVSEGDGALARRPLDLAALAAEVAEVHRPILEAAGIRLEVRAAGPLPVTGDSAALRGAVANFLDNALRHAAAGHEVALEAASRGRMAEVRVLDRGPGIPAGMEERVFERFVRGPDAAGPGAGLGLALVHEAAEAHGGRAAASNREGGGAVFTLALPLREEPA